MNDQARSEQTLLHAIDLALLRDWGQAKALAESIDSPIGERLFLLLSAIEEREAARLRHLANVRHEVGNALSIAQANLEAIVDGLLQPTEQRLNALLAALGTASNVLDNLRRADVTAEEGDTPRIETVNVCAAIETSIASLQRLAASKEVALRHRCAASGDGACMQRGDAVQIGRMLRDTLLGAIRYTPPGGRVEVGCEPDGSSLAVEIHDHGSVAQLPLLTQMLKQMGGKVRVDGNSAETTVVFIDLPLVKPAS